MIKMFIINSFVYKNPLIDSHGSFFFSGSVCLVFPTDLYVFKDPFDVLLIGASLYAISFLIGFSYRRSQEKGLIVGFLKHKNTFGTMDDMGSYCTIHTYKYGALKIWHDVHVERSQYLRIFGEEPLQGSTACSANTLILAMYNLISSEKSPVDCGLECTFADLVFIRRACVRLGLPYTDYKIFVGKGVIHVFVV